MVRYGNLFDLCFSEQSLFEAYLNARKGKRAKRACFEFEKNLGPNLEQLRTELLTGTYQVQPYYEFVIHEPKERIIHSPVFRDVVVQHAIYKVIYPIFAKQFVSTSFACQVGKGTHACANYVQQSMRRYSEELYTVHLDVKRFFHSIDRTILHNLITRKIKDARIVNLMDQFAITTCPTGIPIGNLLSQIYALIYLNPVDHFVKRELKVKHYTRYVDDMVLIGITKENAQQYSREIEEFLENNLNLTLSKTKIAPIKCGLNFVGYRTWKSRRFVRKHSLHKFSRNLRSEDVVRLNSSISHALNTSTLGHYVSRIVNEAPHLITHLTVIKKLPQINLELNYDY